MRAGVGEVFRGEGGDIAEALDGDARAVDIDAVVFGGELRGEGVGREALGGVQRRLRSNLFVDDGCTGKQSAFGNSFGNSFGDSFGDGLAICLAMGPNNQITKK